MANAILLQSGELRGFQPLGADGNPVYQAAPQLRAAIKRKFGEDVANLFAIPQRSEDGSRIDWYAPHAGPVVPWSSATPEEQQQGKQQLLAVRERINEAGRLMQSEQDSERQVFGRLLKHVTSIPNESYVQLVDGRPVLTFWGFQEHGVPPDHDTLSLLPPVTAPATAAVTSAGTAAVAAVPVDAVRRRRFRWWWLWLPLLLLLLAFLLLRGCAPLGLPGLGLPGLDLPAPGFPDGTPAMQTVPSVERVPVVGDGIDPGTGGITRPDAATPGFPDGDGMPDAPSAPELPAEPEVPSGPDAPPEPEVPSEPEMPPEPEVPPEPEMPPEPEVPPEPEMPPEPEVPPRPDVPPVPESQSEPQSDGEALVIPPEAVEQGSTSFLNGRWSADSGLMDRSGRPVEVEYEFNDGEGVARYRRSNGVVCEGPTSAAMEGGQLVITDSANIVCQDGVRYRKSRVECAVGESGLADCAGSYTTGDSFSVGMNKAKNN